jgi:hypothetical protein
MHLTLDARKLQEVRRVSGYSDITQLAEAHIADSIGPAICMREDCSFVCDMETDQEEGYCEECHTNTMKSALVLAELI